MKILSNKKYNQLRGRIFKAELLYEVGIEVTTLLIESFIEREEIFRQEMILNFKEQFK